MDLEKYEPMNYHAISVLRSVSDCSPALKKFCNYLTLYKGEGIVYEKIQNVLDYIEILGTNKFCVTVWTPPSVHYLLVKNFQVYILIT